MSSAGVFFVGITHGKYCVLGVWKIFTARRTYRVLGIAKARLAPAKRNVCGLRVKSFRKPTPQYVSRAMPANVCGVYIKSFRKPSPQYVPCAMRTREAQCVRCIRKRFPQACPAVSPAGDAGVMPAFFACKIFGFVV